MYQTCILAPIWGNLIAGAILGNDSTAPYCNGSDIEQGELLSYCGSNFCPLWEVDLADVNVTSTVLERPSDSQVRVQTCVHHCF